jgi:preprotein translocase subunit SecA
MAALIDEDATAHYERREAELTPTVMREVERQVMLRIIDQRWREHLYEMDYLQEGINLRAMGQKDPLVEWQREGFEMFGQLMHGVANDFARYVTHVQVVRQDQPATAPAAEERKVEAPTMAAVARDTDEQAERDTETDDDAVDREPAVAAARPARRGSTAAPATRVPQTVVKDEWAKTPRNAPCPCGSGKKYKLCHGSNR